MATTPNLVQPFRKLRKTLKGFAELPSVDEAHHLRTHTRRIEAILHALAPEVEHAEHTLKTLKPLRRAAGDVRDLDIFLGLVASLASKEVEQPQLTGLLAQLGDRRSAAAEALYKAVSTRKKKARHRLEQCAHALEDRLNNQVTATELTERLAEHAQKLTTELSRWPRIITANLHPFRLKVKELRYLLPLLPREEAALYERLSRVKDEIGAWHDWSELASLAEEILAPDVAPELLRQIRQRVRAERTKALALARELHRRLILRMAPRKAATRVSAHAAR